MPPTSRKMAFSSWVPSLLFLLFMVSIPNQIFSHAAEVLAAAEMVEMTPVAAAPELWLPMFNGTRRQLESFQICALCTCCGGSKGICLPSPCCYAISCNIPNRPFGFCSFLPKTCNCFGCHL